MTNLSSDITQNIVRLSVALVPILLGMVLHELAHGYAAYKLGDPTPKLQNRLTLNPIKHLDVNGTIVFLSPPWSAPLFLAGLNLSTYSHAISETPGRG